MNLWDGKLHEEQEILVARHTGDFRVILEDLEEECGLEPAESHFVRWIHITSKSLRRCFRATWEPDWDRYTYDAVEEMVDRGVLPEEAVHTYDSPVTWKKVRELGLESEAYEMGLSRYLRGLAKSMGEEGNRVPPVIFVEGSVADGFHRINAANMKGLEWIPAIMLEAKKVSDT